MNKPFVLHARRQNVRTSTPNLPTKILPAKIRRLETSGEFPMDMRIPPLKIKILLESNPPKSRISVQRLDVVGTFQHQGPLEASRLTGALDQHF